MGAATTAACLIALGGGVALADLVTIQNVPGNMTLTAGANDQAAVTFTPPVSVHDSSGEGGACGGSECTSEIDIGCTATNGSTLTISGTPKKLTGGTFKLGTTTVTCTTPTEEPGERATASFTVTVNDQTLSFANVPSTITVDATSPNGSIVTYTAPTAFEGTETETIPVRCLPASGSVFAINAPGNFTTVTCTARDPDGPSTASFMVHVRGAAEQITNLIAVVDSIPGGKQSFEDQLQTALADLNAGNIAQACGDLTGFINHVRAQSGKQLTVSQASQLISAAQQIRAVLGCK